MMEDYQHQPSFPSLPPPAIVVHQHTSLKPLNHIRNMDPRISHSLQSRQILEDLNHSIKPSERWQILRKALHLFSHDNVELHDDEINMGIDKALCLKLGYVVVTTQSVYISKEVILICNCLTEILKCSSINRLRSFRHVGATELLPLLIQLWTSIIQSKIERENQPSEFDDGLVSIVRVLRVFSKLPAAKSYLINYLQGAFLGHLLRDILIWINEPSSSILYSSTEVLWEILGLVKDLTFRSRTDDKKMLLYLEEEILFNILSACFERIEGFKSRFQEWCTAIIWNLVLDSSICQNLLSKTFGSDKKFGNMIVEGLLQVLIQHSTIGKNGKNVSLSLKIKRNATSALGNIVSDSKNHTILFQNKCETKLSALIPQLTSSAQRDSDPVIRRRAMRTIRCLAGSIDIEAKNFFQKGNLFSFLIDLISQNGVYEDENDNDMLIQACQTVIVLKESIKVEFRSQLQIALLHRIENATCTNIIPVTALCLSECMGKNLTDRSPSFSMKFWNNLERLVSASSKIHAPVSILLITIAKMEKRLGSVKDQDIENPSVLTKTPVINTLTTILLKSGYGEEHAKDQALEVVQILAENKTNKRLLAENDRLLSGLVTLCLTQPNSKIKDSAKIIILQLVPEI